MYQYCTRVPVTEIIKYYIYCGMLSYGVHTVYRTGVQYDTCYILLQGEWAIRRCIFLFPIFSLDSLRRLIFIKNLGVDGSAKVGT